MKVYAVAEGRKRGIYFTYSKCREQVFGYKGAKFKSFKSIDDAIEWMEHHGYVYENKVLASYGLNLEAVCKFKKGEKIPKQETDTEYYRKNCMICERPMNIKGELCSTCKTNKKKCSELLGIQLNNRKFLALTVRYNTYDLFSFFQKNPYANSWLDRETVHNIRKKKKAEILERKDYDDCDSAPGFIISMLQPHMKFVSIEGAKHNPTITYHCLRCEEDIRQTYASLIRHKGHNCTAIVSSGEALVSEYLKELGVDYLTQRDTLRCVNPSTGYVMPYDFELPKYKLIIEVQGEQHREFIEVFHIDEEGFEYQLEKDRIKRDFALSKGYDYLEIWYEDFENEVYKDKLNEKILL